MKTETERIETYAEFWDYYVREHSQPLTRYLHFVGTTLGLVLLAWIFQSGNWIYTPLCFVVGYAFAWFAHFFVEHNQPATLSIRGGLSSPITKWFYMLTGKMNREIERVAAK